nr:MAG TPA: hypothetical protein [Bacteriophage sp.]
MNHRQWKKAYKKKYGHNPPSKRNSPAKENIIPQFKMPDISEIVSKIFETLGNAFANAAEVSKRIAEDLKRSTD